jgi:thiosulfate/3-mercaptopyruvate sulfurtransferase
MSDFTTLISAAALAEKLSDPALVLFDCRHDLMNPEAGERAYRATHIRGAQFLHLDRELSGPKTGANGRHPLPEPGWFANLLAERGVDNDSLVVAYDDADGIFAARLWWMLRWLGHDRVAVLDGGFNDWVDRGLPRASGVERRPPSRFGYRLRAGAVVDCPYVMARLTDRSTLVVDARAPERFRGEVEPLDPVAGHVPGATNRFFRDNLDDEGRFKPAGVLAAEFAALTAGREARNVLHMCGSGVTACHNLLAMEIAGVHGSRLFAGSWSEWCADPARPVERSAGELGAEQWREALSHIDRHKEA